MVRTRPMVLLLKLTADLGTEILRSQVQYICVQRDRGKRSNRPIGHLECAVKDVGLVSRKTVNRGNILPPLSIEEQNIPLTSLQQGKVHDQVKLTKGPSHFRNDNLGSVYGPFEHVTYRDPEVSFNVSPATWHHTRSTCLHNAVDNCGRSIAQFLK